jgi:hypothetical protein
MYKVQNAITELLMIPNRPSNGVKIPPMTNWKVVLSIFDTMHWPESRQKCGYTPIHTYMFVHMGKWRSQNPHRTHKAKILLHIVDVD